MSCELWERGKRVNEETGEEGKREEMEEQLNVQHSTPNVESKKYWMQKDAWVKGPAYANNDELRNQNDESMTNNENRAEAIHLKDSVAATRRWTQGD